MRTRSEWLSLHVHYNSDPHWLLRDGIAPVIRALRERELLARYFFIRYWEQGPHVRLRFQASSHDREREAAELTESTIYDYLRRRPSVFRFPTRHMPPSFSQLFIAEYGAGELERRYGPSGQIPFAENNHIVEIPYLREYSRYGGKVGVVIAEKHFEVSSDHVLRALSEENGHDFRIILGRGFRMMLYTCMALLPERGSQLRFLENYQQQWNGLIGNVAEAGSVQFDRKYRASKPALDRSTAGCVELFNGTEEGRCDDREWLEHIRGVRHDLERAMGNGLLDLPEGVESVEQAIHYLIPAYVHMTNNRLGISIADEVYMAYIMRRSLEDYDA